jgi:Ca2+/H+ antiporter
MARHLLGIVAGAITGFVCIVLVVAILVVVSWVGLIELPKVVESVLVCIAAAAAAYVAGRVGRTDGATVGVIAVLVVEALLYLFQRQGGTIQLAVDTAGSAAMPGPKLWFGVRILLGLILGAQGSYVWRRKAARREEAASKGELQPMAEDTLATSDTESSGDR